MKVFLFRSNRQADQSRCPPYPEGMPAGMLTYDRFADERGWHPRQVDALTRAELFWLPVIRAAKEDAAQQLAKAKD